MYFKVSSFLNTSIIVISYGELYLYKIIYCSYIFRRNPYNNQRRLVSLAMRIIATLQERRIYQAKCHPARVLRETFLSRELSLS